MLLQIVLEEIPQQQEAVVGVVIGAITAALGIYQAIKSEQALKELEKEEKPTFEVSPELQKSQRRAEELAKTGFSPEETAAFEQRIAREGETAFRRATDIAGGELAPAIGAGIQSQRITAIGQFSAAGAQLRRQNIRYADVVGKQIQQQENLATQEAIADRIRREQAFGTAQQAGLENIVEGVTTGVALESGETTNRQFIPTEPGDTSLQRRQLNIQGLQ